MKKKKDVVDNMILDIESIQPLLCDAAIHSEHRGIGEIQS